MRRLPYMLLAAVVCGVPVTSLAQTQGRQGLNTIIQPIVPERQIGLPDKAPPSEGAASAPAATAPVSRKAGAAAAPEKTEPAAAAAAQYGVWKTECLDKAAKPNCQAILRSAVGDQIALVVGITAPTKNAASRMQIAAPLGLAIENGLSIKIGDYSGKFPISRCTAQGCLVEAEAPEPLVDALKKGTNGTAVIYSVDGQAIKLPLPVASFSKSYEAINAGN